MITITIMLIVLMLPCNIAIIRNMKTEEANYASSIVELRKLLIQEKKFILLMSEYAEELKAKLDFIETFLRRTKQSNLVALQKGNPLKNFSLIRRLKADWNYWLQLLQEPIAKDTTSDMLTFLDRVPNSKDFNEAVEGIQRLQIVYSLKPADIANGWLNGKQYNAKLSAMDSFFIGVELAKIGCEDNALNWFMTSLRIKYDEEVYKDVFSFDIESMYNIYKVVANAVEYRPKTLQTLLSMPEIKYIPIRLAAIYEPKTRTLNLATIQHSKKTSPDTVLHSYQQSCKGQPIPSISNKFVCSIEIDPFYMIAHFKFEILHLRPYIALYYNVLTNKTIEAAKKCSKNHLKLASYQSKSEENKNEPTKRLAKGYYLINASKTFDIRYLYQRVVAITKLYSHPLEEPQIINYGIGGHYSLHYDLLGPNVDKNGERLASVVMYLSDVEQGGATVFPLLNISVLPQKGAALIWFNLQNGLPNYSTLHSSCPVLVGSKWIIVTWVRVQNKF